MCSCLCFLHLLRLSPSCSPSTVCFRFGDDSKYRLLVGLHVGGVNPCRIYLVVLVDSWICLLDFQTQGFKSRDFLFTFTRFFTLYVLDMCFCAYVCILISLSCEEVEPAQRETYCGKMCQQFLFNTSLLKGKVCVTKRERWSQQAAFLGQEELFTQWKTMWLWYERKK